MSVDPKHLAGWINDLSSMTGGRSGDADLAVKIAAITHMLEKKAEPEWFTKDSLEFCLRKFKFFPSYAELWARLQGYNREREKQFALAAPVELPYDGHGLSNSDRIWIKGWNDKRTGNRAEAAVFLSCVRKYASDGFKLLVRDDEIARDIAMKRDWVHGPKEEPAADTAPVMQTVTATLSVPKEAPPPKPTIAERAQEERGRPLGALSPEQLQTARKNAGSSLAQRPSTESEPVPAAERVAFPPPDSTRTPPLPAPRPPGRPPAPPRPPNPQPPPAAAEDERVIPVYDFGWG